jgi:hypothetical protein
MASWIVHLRIAENLLARIPSLDPEKFALGNVAPDSGRPDEKWEHFTPPGEVTHFENPSALHRDCADLEFFRRYLKPLGTAPDRRLFSFRLGYFFHLITDNLWALKIARPTLERYREQFAADKDFIWVVKKDWYGLDFIYLRDHPDCLFWRVFTRAQPELGGLDFLVPESLSWSVAHIQKYYQRNDENIQELYNRSYIYLSMPDVDCFVDESAQQLARIFEQLWINAKSVDGAASALDLEI